MGKVKAEHYILYLINVVVGSPEKKNDGNWVGGNQSFNGFNCISERAQTRIP